MKYIYKDEKRYSEVMIASVKFLIKEERRERGVLWYNYFTGISKTYEYGSDEFFSTKFEEDTRGIILNEPQKIRYVIDYQVRNWKRILGVVQKTDSSSSNELENDDIPF